MVEHSNDAETGVYACEISVNAEQAGSPPFIAAITAPVQHGHPRRHLGHRVERVQVSDLRS